jgi:hypothetical protein
MNVALVFVLTLAAADGDDTSLPSTTLAECVADKAGRVTCGFGCITGPRGDVQCAEEPGGTCLADAAGLITCTPPTGLTIRVPLTPAGCKQGADGTVACGYDCVIDAAGSPVCANTPDGACLVSPTGVAGCSDLPPARRLVLLTDRIAPECRRNGAGGVVCGFGCVESPRGEVRCAKTPDGACAADKAGSLVCTEFDIRQRIFLGPPPQSMCLKGAEGRAVCGYGCVREANGNARCSASPLGACATGANGHARCFPDDQ